MAQEAESSSGTAEACWCGGQRAIAQACAGARKRFVEIVRRSADRSMQTSQTRNISPAVSGSSASVLTDGAQ